MTIDVDVHLAEWDLTYNYSDNHHCHQTKLKKGGKKKINNPKWRHGCYLTVDDLGADHQIFFSTYCMIKRRNEESKFHNADVGVAVDKSYIRGIRAFASHNRTLAVMGVCGPNVIDS